MAALRRIAACPLRMRVGTGGAFSCALSARRQSDEPNRKPDGLEESSPDHKARHNLHGKPESNQNEVARLKRFGS